MLYKFDLNLQQKAALRTAIWFWERKEVKAKAAEFFDPYDEPETGQTRQEWREFTKTVVDEWNKDVLPEHLEVELIHLVKMKSKLIFDWYLHITKEYGATEDAINCINKIKWTPYGTVDEVQTFKSSWLDNSNLHITVVYNFACRYVISDHINELWNKIPKDTQKCFYGDNIYSRFDQHILAYWKHCRNNNLRNLMRCFQVAANDFSTEDMEVFNLIYDLSRSTEENMLRLSVYQGYFIATKYFWEELTEEERHESMLKCARIALLRGGLHVVGHHTIEVYKISQYVEICIFLMNQMTNRDKKAFFNGDLHLELGLLNRDEFDVKNKILLMLLFTWPWEELFFPVLEDMLRYVDDDSKMDCKFLDAIAYYMREDHKLGYSLEASKYRCLLRKVWLIIPAHFKQKIPQINPYSRVINNLIDMWDLVSLNLILNDPETAAVRDQLIDFGCNSYKQFVVNDQFEKLDQLIEEIFQFEEEQKKSFKQKINPWSDIFKDYNFDLADKLLDWQSSTPEERQSLKNNIDHMELCRDFVNSRKYELLDKFLDWKFETIGVTGKSKDHSKNDMFAMLIFHIWELSNGDTNYAKMLSSIFLNAVFKFNHETITLFKKKKLVNLETNRSTMNYLIQLKRDNMMDDFLFWCWLDVEEVQRIKQVVSEQNQRL